MENGQFNVDPNSHEFVQVKETQGRPEGDLARRPWFFKGAIA